MNFSFWPFLWFGLPGRLLMVVALHMDYLLKRKGEAFLLTVGAFFACS